jgi:hypothetical protein
MQRPEGTRRLFPHWEESGLDLDSDLRAAPFLISRLLEDGDAADLGWLVATLGEPALATWLERSGARQLSNRSRAFWEMVLDRPAPTAAADSPAVRRALWPL